MANTIILPFSELQAELNDEAMIDPNAIIEITENGLYNVAKYGYANVNVEGGGGGETWETVFEGSVTTEQAPIGDPRGLIEGLSSLTADTIKVTFNGTEYTCEKQEFEGDISYGDSDGSYSEYPFYISNGGDGVYLTTETTGTYTLKIEEPQSGGESDFSIATLTITNTTENPVICEVPCYRDGTEIVSTRAVTFGAVGDEPTTTAFNVICKTGGATLTLVTSGVTATTSGNIQYIEAEHMYIITGDCTITISAGE